MAVPGVQDVAAALTKEMRMRGWEGGLRGPLFCPIDKEVLRGVDYQLVRRSSSVSLTPKLLVRFRSIGDMAFFISQNRFEKKSAAMCSTMLHRFVSEAEKKTGWDWIIEEDITEKVKLVAELIDRYSTEFAIKNSRLSAVLENWDWEIPKPKGNNKKAFLYAFSALLLMGKKMEAIKKFDVIKKHEILVSDEIDRCVFILDQFESGARKSLSKEFL